LDDYVDLFFPGECSTDQGASQKIHSTFADPLVTSLQKTQVEGLTANMKRAFLDNELEIDISCGPEYEPLRVCVSEFVPENDRAASQPVISTDQQSQSSIFTRRYPAPVAMKNLDMGHLGESLRRHAESVVAVQRGDSSNQKPNTISKRLLGVIGRYHSSKSQYDNVCFLIQNLFPKQMFANLVLRKLFWTKR
jgi:hypothetical protein